MVEALWSLIQLHPYLALFPLMLLEGPLATVAAGALVGAGKMTFFLAGALAVVAEVTADLAIFTAGRFSRHERLRRLLSRLGVTEARRAPLEASLTRNLPGVLAGAKVVDAAAVPVILAAGASGVSYTRFVSWNLALSIPKSLLLLSVGALFGAQVSRFLSPTTSLLAALGGLAAYLLVITFRNARRTAALQGAQS